MSNDAGNGLLPLTEANAKEYLTRGGWTKDEAVLILNGLDPVANSHLLQDDSPPVDPMLATYWYAVRRFAPDDRVTPVDAWLSWAVVGTNEEPRQHPLAFSRDLREAHGTQNFNLLVRRLADAMGRPAPEDTDSTAEHVWPPQHDKKSRGVKQINLSICVTPQDLLSAFGQWGLEKQWFNAPRKHAWLIEARKMAGKGGRKPTPPLYCPYEVMVGLRAKSRIGKNRFTVEKGWKILKDCFPKAFSHFEGFMPDHDQSKNDL